MNLQKACELLEVLSEEEVGTGNGKLTFKEFHALQIVLLELQQNGLYNPKSN